jgi:hypothetical protein
VARKHIAWYTKGLKNSAVFRARMNTLDDRREAARRREGILRRAARALERARIRRRERGRACSLNTGAGETPTPRQRAVVDGAQGDAPVLQGPGRREGRPASTTWWSPRSRSPCSRS